jgi:hypothetical protein
MSNPCATINRGEVLTMNFMLQYLETLLWLGEKTRDLVVADSAKGNIRL